MSLETDLLGRWFDGTGEEIPDLRGCHEVDISATPFTNTLTIGRLNLETRQAARLKVVSICLPEWTLRPVEQVYACGRKGEAYYHRTPPEARDTLLPVDENLILFDYPGLFRRVG